MGLVSKQFTFSAGATIIAAEHNANFDDLFNVINGSLSNTNIASNAAIADSKLAAITTATKVAGTSLYQLNAITSTAGIIPIANLPTGLSANQLIKILTNNTLPAMDGSLLTGISASQISSASLGTGTPSSSNYLRGDRTWAAVSTGAPVTVAYTANTAGNTYTFSNTGNVASISKTITSGNTVVINSSGYYLNNVTVADTHTFTLFAGATSVQTVKSSCPAGDDNSFSMNATVLGLSGATTFWIKTQATYDYTNTAWGNLTVMEF